MGLGGTVVSAMAQREPVEERYPTILERNPFTNPAYYNRPRAVPPPTPPPPPIRNNLANEVRLVSYSEFPRGTHNFTLIDLAAETGVRTDTLRVGESTERFQVESYLPPETADGSPGVRIRAGTLRAEIRLIEGSAATAVPSLTAVQATVNNRGAARSSSSSGSNQPVRRTVEVNPTPAGNRASPGAPAGNVTQVNLSAGIASTRAPGNSAPGGNPNGSGQTPGSGQAGSGSDQAGTPSGDGEPQIVRRRIVPRRRFISTPASDEN